MTDEPTVQPADPAGSGGGAEGDAPPANDSAPSATTDTAAWRNMIPKDYRDDPALKDYKDFGGFVKSHIHLSQLLGREPRVPAKDAPPDQWAQFYSALGRPDTADKYVLPIPEGDDAPEVIPEAVEGFRAAAHAAGLTNSQAHKVAEWYFGFLAEQSDAVASEIAGKTERVERELRREYGKAYDNKIRAATQFFEDFGGKELIDWMETSGEGSNPLLIRLGVKLADLLAEDRLGRSRPGDFGYTPQEAQAEIGRLAYDKEFQTALNDSEHPGHKAAVERKRALYEAAYPTEDHG